MKLIIFLFLLVSGASGIAQNIDALTNTIWEVTSYYAKPENGDDEIFFYHKDSSDNIHNFDNFTYTFDKSNTVTLAVDAISEEKEWSLYSNNDSLSIGKGNYKIVTLTNDSLIVKTTATKYGIELDYYIRLSDVKVLALGNHSSADKLFSLTFPSPIKDEISIDLSKIDEKVNRISIYSDQGILVKDIYPDNNDLLKVSLQEISSGIFILYLIDENGTVITTQKLVKE